jgi:hypothetical protein
MPQVSDSKVELLAALKAACGYLMNARIDLMTGAPKKTAMMTIDGGLSVVRAALAKAEGREQALADGSHVQQVSEDGAAPTPANTDAEFITGRVAALEMYEALKGVQPLCEAINSLMTDDEDLRAKFMALLIRFGLQDDYGFKVANAIAKAEGEK